MPQNLPDGFKRTIIGTHGDAGETWLQHLPELIARLSSEWNLTIGPTFKLNHNYAAQATMMDSSGDALEVVLKIGFPGTDLNRELVALHYYRGEGSAKLIRGAPIEGALLLERLKPGASLDQGTPDDEASVVIAAGVMRELWRPIPQIFNFPTLADWFTGLAVHRSRFNGTPSPLPESLLKQCETLVADLLASTSNPMLLHGDLHHGNILTAERAPYLAIDPKGVIGDPAFEPSAFLLNPHPVSGEAMSRRLTLFADTLQLERRRIREWGIARSVLSACWTLEDNGTDAGAAIAVAQQLQNA